MSRAAVPVFVLAGGRGLRLGEATAHRPKPLVELAGMPLVVHVLERYAAAGFEDFTLCGGYRADALERYFRSHPPSYGRVRVLDLGVERATGARLAAAIDHVAAEHAFEELAVAYSDCLTDARLEDVHDFHRSHGRIGTLLGVHCRSRHGELTLAGDRVVHFEEKPFLVDRYINGGYYFFRREFRSYLETNVDFALETNALATLARGDELRTFRYEGFWSAVDDLGDHDRLETLWRRGECPWRPTASH